MSGKNFLLRMCNGTFILVIVYYWDGDFVRFRFATAFVAESGYRFLWPHSAVFGPDISSL